MIHIKKLEYKYTIADLRRASLHHFSRYFHRAIKTLVVRNLIPKNDEKMQRYGETGKMYIGKKEKHIQLT